MKLTPGILQRKHDPLIFF